VPIARLTSKAYARDLARSIEPARASLSAELGKDILSVPQRPEPDDTTHFSVLDRQGMAVSNTFTLEGSYGSHVVIAGTGILMNNEMGDFNRHPGLTDDTGTIGTPANVIAPGKRMLSSMTPTIVTRNGRVVLVTGSPGSRTIINTVLGVVLNVTAWGLTGADAVEAPRMDHEWMPDRLTIEANGIDAATAAALRAMGHDVRLQGRQGSAQTIWVDASGTPFGIADKRDATAKAAAAK
jgi:gamma-glutamyltranspeptidase/glutathione hydrolase